MRFRTFIIISSVLFYYFPVNGQELFPLTEPASTVPKGIFGVRSMGEFYKEVGTTRGMLAARIMYGLTSKLTLEVTASGSNHHDTILPANLLYHTHAANGANIYSAQSFTRGLHYPFLFAGFNFYAKYRILSSDGDKSHFRIALFGDYSTVKAAHDEAEPGLLEDDGGWEAGFIATKLIDRLAISITSGYIQPSFHFTEYQSQYIYPTQVTELYYGRAIEYDLSFGYRVFPVKYNNDYSAPNFNIYVEFLGKTYDSATVKVDGEIASIKTPVLMQSTYIEIHPGIQWIINSDTRVELSVGYPLIHHSYVVFYPLFNVGVQSYIFFKKDKSAKAE